MQGQELDQRQVDQRLLALDGTPTKSRLGANALLGVSMAVAKVAAAAAREPLYVHLGRLAGTSAADYVLPAPMMNILNGGAHADSSVDLQEFMVMPVGMPTFAEALRAGTEIFHALRAILKKAGHSTGVGDEGGFAPNLKSNREALDIVLEAIARAGLRAGQDVYLALDVASSELWKDGQYVFRKSGEATRSSAEMVEMYTDWVRQYPIVSIEDGLAEGDWDGWKVLTKALGDRVPRHFLRFLQTLVRKRRKMLIPQISAEYDNLLDVHEGRVHANVTVASAVSESEMSDIARQLSRVVGKTVVPHMQVNPAILGGVVVKIGDTVMDGSVRRRLARLKSRMLAH